MIQFKPITNTTVMKNSFFSGKVPKGTITVFDKFQVTNLRCLCRIDAFARDTPDDEAINIELYDGTSVVGTVTIAIGANEGSTTGIIALEVGKTYYLRTNQTGAFDKGGNISVTWHINQA